MMEWWWIFHCQVGVPIIVLFSDIQDASSCWHIALCMSHVFFQWIGRLTVLVWDSVSIWNTNYWLCNAYMDGICTNIYIYIFLYVVHELNILLLPNIVICHDLSIFQRDFACCIFVLFFFLELYIYIYIITLHIYMYICIYIYLLLSLLLHIIIYIYIHTYLCIIYILWIFKVGVNLDAWNGVRLEGTVLRSWCGTMVRFWGHGTVQWYGSVVRFWGHGTI